MSHTITSLTSPSDRKEGGTRVTSEPATLTSEQTEKAMEELYITDFVKKFPQRERVFCDPIYLNQVFGLHSFVPSRGATPDKDGVYGMVKFRGAFTTKEEADKRAEELIKNCDSYHNIFTSYIGRPFPATVDPKFSAERNEVDVRKKTAEVVSEDVKAKRDQERKEIEEIKQREERLKEDVRTDQSPEDRYITLRVKKAQLVWTYLENTKKLREMKDIIRKTSKEIKEMDSEYPNFIQSYKDRYFQARRESGLKDDDTSFIRYLGEDTNEEDYLNDGL